MKSSLILALLAISFVVALSSPHELIFRDRMKQFRDKMNQHLSQESQEQQEPRNMYHNSHEMSAWKTKRLNLHHADYEPSEETERPHHRHHDNFRRNRLDAQDRYNPYERRFQYQPEYNSQMNAGYPSFSGRRWFSPNAEMHNNRFSRFNSPLNQFEHHKESLEEKIERMEKKLNELKRTQKYQQALERVMERLARKKAEAEKGSQ